MFKLRRVHHGWAGVPALLFLLGIWLFFIRNADAQPTPAYKISAIRAKLFYEDKGTFSGDVLTEKYFALWNVIIGEGSAEGNSNATLVLVEITGKPGASEIRRKVAFTAVAGKGSRARTLLKRTLSTGILSNRGKWYGAFWLQGTGCEPVTLTARLTGQAQPFVMRRTIDFRCGE